MFHALVFGAALAALAAPRAPLRAQAADAPQPTLRGLSLDAGLLRPGAAPATAAFGAALDLAPGRLPGLLRLGVSSWIADLADGNAVRGRDVSLLWLFRAAPAGPDWHLFAGAGPALAARGDGSAPASSARAALAAQSGLQLSLAPRDALELELRLGALAPARGPSQLSLRLGLRLAPGAARGLLAGEPPPPTVAIDAEPAPPPPDLADVLAGAGGVLVPARAGGGLRLEEVAFDSGGTDLTRDSFARLAAAGRTLRRLRAQPLHVVIYTEPGGSVEARRASLRAVSVARALARGGYPRRGIFLEAAAPPPGEGGVGQIVAGSRCARDCVVPARP